MIFARKIYKIPEFYMIFARKMPAFYVIIAREILFFFPNFRGARAPCPRLLRLCIGLVPYGFVGPEKGFQALVRYESERCACSSSYYQIFEKKSLRLREYATDRY